MDHKKAVLKALCKAREKYYFIGIELGFNSDDLKEIEGTYLPDKLRCLIEVLECRIQRGGLTRSMVCSSLRGEFVQRDDVAKARD